MIAATIDVANQRQYQACRDLQSAGLGLGQYMSWNQNIDNMQACMYMMYTVYDSRLSAAWQQ